MDKMKEQNTEGCRLAGRVRVNKVSVWVCICSLLGSDDLGYWKPALQSWPILPEQHASNARIGMPLTDSTSKKLINHLGALP
jgi:hypothetical protein